MNNYIKLSDDYYLDTDKLNYILVKKHIGKKGKSEGKEVFSNILFCGKIEWLFEYLVDNQILADKTILTNMEKIVKLKDDLIKMVSKLEMREK